MAKRENDDTTGRQSAPAAASSALSTPAKAGFTPKACLLTCAVTVLVVWVVGAIASVYFYPRLAYSQLQNAVVNHGIGEPDSPGIPINTLYTQPTLASSSQSNSLLSTGNRDTLYTV